MSNILPQWSFLLYNFIFMIKDTKDRTIYFACARTCAHAHAHTCMHSCICMCAHTHAHVHAHTCAHARMHKHVHTHTRTHLEKLSNGIGRLFLRQFTLSQVLRMYKTIWAYFWNPSHHSWPGFPIFDQFCAKCKNLKTLRKLCVGGISRKKDTWQTKHSIFFLL